MYVNDGSSLRCFLLKCPERKRKEFNVSEVALLISVGQPYHENEALWATMNFVNKSFKKCHVMVNDSLQRHTIMLNECGNITLEEAYKKSMQNGRKWIKINSQFLDILTIPHEIHYWNSWLNRDDYIIHKNKVDGLYSNDPEFKKNMDISIQEFIGRNQNKAEKIGLDKAYDLCLEYLLEECAVIMGIWQSCKYNFILYPGKIIPILKYTHSSSVSNDILYWLHVKFRRNNKKLYKEKIGLVL